MTTEQRTANNNYEKLAVHWLNKFLCFVSSSVVADSFRPLAPQGLQSYGTKKVTPITICKIVKKFVTLVEDTNPANFN
jgi:hypothetical protein